MADRILIIIPTYNERENLPQIVAAVHSHLPEAQVLVVDDNSPDGTGQIADEVAQQSPWVEVLHRPGKQGLGRAYIAGFRQALAAGYEYIFELDADFSHDPAYLPILLAETKKGADVAVGSRWIFGGGTKNWGLGRQMISRGGSLYARTVLGVGIRDLTSGFVCYRRTVLERIDLESVHSRGYGFQIEMKYRAVLLGFRVREVPITFVDRRVGDSKMSRDIVLEAVRMVWQLRFQDLPRAHS